MDDDTNQLPAELEMLSACVDGLAPPVRQAFHYCLCLMMVETGKMSLLTTMPGEDGQLCLFATTNGEQFWIPRPPLLPEEEKALTAELREILQDENLL